MPQPNKCPADHRKSLEACGVDPAHIDKLEADGFDWSKLFQIIQLILQMLATQPKP